MCGLPVIPTHVIVCTMMTYSLNLTNKKFRVVDASVLSKHVNMNSEFFDKPGFLYFLEVPCETWDILQYHEAWRKAQHPMNKAAVITAIKRQLGWFQTNGSRDEIIAAKRLLKQLKEDMKRGRCIDNFWADVASRCTLDTKRVSYHFLFTDYKL
ncbi:hypothetical protein BC938DRAFT_479042, partial [Jimgerdemannia flammicorona]